MFKLFGLSVAYQDNFSTIFVFLRVTLMVANQALYIHYNSRHWHKSYDGKFLAINCVGMSTSSDFFT